MKSVKDILKKCYKVLKYILSPKKYCNSIELCGAYTEYLANLIFLLMPNQLKNRKKIVCFSPYSEPLMLRRYRHNLTFFYTQENTHVEGSKWQKWENCYLWKNSPTLSLGFDYYNHPNYIRFPYWLNAMFNLDFKRNQINSFVSDYMYADIQGRTKSCAFVCRSDYFGDRAQIADMVEHVMPLSYPSDFRHNDDDMRGKFGDDKNAYLRQFKFNLCPENSNNRGYVTEKIFQAIKAGCVPIYWGNEGYPEPDILNPKAIVYLDKDHPEEGLALLRKLYEDPKAYAEFASQPRFLPGAADKIYAYYERLEARLKSLCIK